MLLNMLLPIPLLLLLSSQGHKHCTIIVFGHSFAQDALYMCSKQCESHLEWQLAQKHAGNTKQQSLSVSHMLSQGIMVVSIQHAMLN